MTETVKLHGGPKHGVAFAIQEGQHTLLVEVLIRETVNDSETLLLTRTGAYTRVWKNNRATKDFEWSGYSQPAKPLEGEPK